MRKLCAIFLLSFFDLVSIVSGFYTAFLLRKYFFPLFIKFPSPEPLPFSLYVEGMGFLPGIWLIIFYFQKLYLQKDLGFWKEAELLFVGNIFAFMFVYFYAYFTQYIRLYSRAVLTTSLPIVYIYLVFFRYFMKKLIVSFNLWKRRVIIIGAGKTGEKIVENIEKNKLLGFEIIGFLDDDENKIGKKIKGYKVLGKVGDIKKFHKNVDEAIISISEISSEKLRNLIIFLNKYVSKVNYIPNLEGLTTINFEILDLNGILVLELKDNLLLPPNRFLKRCVDLFLSILLLMIFAPLFIIISIAIKKEDGGPVFFKQERLGQYGRKFLMYKFRTMVENAEEVLKDLLEKNPELKKEYEKTKKLKNDPRLTKVGKFLRRWSLDELPQLINVLKGEMSIVGPRPLLEREKKDYGDWLDFVLKVKPGITGLWQVSGRSELPFKERTILDVYYVKTWSLWLDFVIILKTIPAILSRKGAY